MDADDHEPANRPIQAILTGETDYMKALSDAETIFNTNNNR